MEAAILGAELYGPGIVVVVDGSRLITGEKGSDPESWDDEAASLAPSSALETTTFTAAALTWLPKLTNVHVWRIPPVGALPGVLKGVVGRLLPDLASRG